MITFEPQGAHSTKIARATQRAIRVWRAQKPSMGKFPRPNQPLKAIASTGVAVLLLSGCTESAPTTRRP